MLSCWRVSPESRPSFNDIENSFSKMLESNVAEHYIDLNEPYLKSNETNFGRGQTDYIALMGSPDCQAPYARHNYVNHTIQNQMSSPIYVNSQQMDEQDRPEEIPMHKI